MVPLDLTHTALLTKQIEHRLLSDRPSKFRQMWIDLGRFFAQKYEIVFGFKDGPPLHDVCAVHIASLVGRGINSEAGGKWFGRKMYCLAETGEGRARGQTICDVGNHLEGAGKITVASTMEVSSLPIER
jgi:inosine-uridine nucleoside N-ribohydrolase